MYYDNKYEYLESKLKIEESCPKMCKEYSEILGEIICGVCFWKNIIIPYENIPECLRCCNDMEKFKNKLKSSENIISLKLECSKHCLWFDWFNSKRNNLAINNSKNIIYIKRDENIDNINQNNKKNQNNQNINNNNPNKNNQNNKNNNNQNKNNQNKNNHNNKRK